MDYSKIDLKVREAHFFLSKMTQAAKSAAAGAMEFSEEVGFYFSAFLSASRSVEFKIDYIAGSALYKAWLEKWVTALPPPDRELFDTMNKERNLEVHRKGANRSRTETRHEVRAGAVHNFGDGGTGRALGLSGTSVTVFGDEHQITIAGTDHEVVSASESYLRLVEQMLKAFKAKYP